MVKTNAERDEPSDAKADAPPLAETNGWLSATLAADQLLDGPPARRARSNMRKVKELALWEPEACAAHLERAWQLGWHDPAILGQLRHDLKDFRATARLMSYHRERIDLAARAGDAAAFVEAVVDMQVVAVPFRLPAQDKALAGFTEDLLAPLRRPLTHPPAVPARLCYIVALPADSGSTLPAISFEMAAMHDGARLEASVFVPEREAVVRRRNPALLTHVEAARAAGIETVFAEAGFETPLLERLLSWRDQLQDRACDILVFMWQAFEHYLLAALRPGHLLAGWDMGSPDWYTSPFLDVSFAGHPHACMESRCDSVFLPLGLTRDHQARGTALTRGDLGVPDDGPLLMVSGSADKLSVAALWRALRDILDARPCRLLVLGVPPEKAAPFQNDWPDGMRARCHVVARRPDFAEVIGVCDIYLDTVPVGGGFAVMEAMRQAKPCVLVHHDVGRIFDKSANYNTMSFLGFDPDMAVPHDDQPAYVARALAYLDSEDERQRQVARQNVVIPGMTRPRDRMVGFETEVLDRLASMREPVV